MAQTILIKRSNTSGAVPTTSQLSVGELALNTRDGKIYMRKYVDGTTSNDTITLIGDNSTIAATTLTGNLSMGDNVRAVFGTGNDLQIYHDGNNSYIRDLGQGNLYITANEFRVGNADNSKDYIHGNNGAEVKLFYNNSQKLATTSTGIDVTGSVVADGLTVDAAQSNFNDSAGSVIAFQKSASAKAWIANRSYGFHNGNGLAINTTDANPIRFGTNNTERMRIDSSGRVGIGTSSVLRKLQVVDSAFFGTTNSGVVVGDNGGVASVYGMNAAGDTYKPFEIRTGSSGTGFNQDTSGRVGIGTSSPSENLSIVGSANTGMNIQAGTSHIAFLDFGDSGDTNFGGINYNNADDTLNLRAGNSNRLTINSSGNASFSGAVTANAGVVVDNITIDGNEIDVSSGNLTLDVAGDIILDADGGDVRLKDNGTEFLNFYAGTIERTGSLVFDVSGNITLNADGSTISLSDGSLNFGQFYQNASGALNIYAPTQDKDIVFLGNDGGSTVTALTLDMSAAGEAIFNSDIRLFDSKAVRFGTDQDFRISNDGSHTTLQNSTADQDILIKGNDGGSTITALTLDMSNAGKATFSGIVSSAQGFERGNMFITQNEIDVSSGNLHIDVASSIILDSDAGNVYLRDSGTDVGLLSMANTDLYIRSLVSDRDIIFQGYDGSSNITALTLDMSASGAATFNSSVTATGLEVEASTPVIEIDSTTPANLATLQFTTSGTVDSKITHQASSGDMVIESGRNSTWGGKIYLKTDTFQNAVFTRTTSTFNENGADIDFRVEGVGSSHALFVQGSDGKVGIGTTSPDTNLDLTSSGVHGLILNEDTGNSSASSRLFFKSAQRTNTILNVSGNLEFRTGATINSTSGTVRMAIIGSSGAIRFNNAFTFPTADGSANQLLKTDGSGNMSWVTVSGAGTPSYISDGDGDTKIQVEESSDEDKIRFDANGAEVARMGFNSSSESTLEIVRNGVPAQQGQITFNGSGLITDVTSGYHSLIVRNGGSEHFRVRSNGNVGIGNSAPTSYSGYKILHIGSAASGGTGLLKFGTGSTSDGPELYAPSSGNRLHINTSGAANVLNLVNSNVGIGTTAPQEKLHVYNTGTSRVEAEGTTGFAALKATNNSGSYGWYVDDSADKFHLYDFTDNADRITVDGSGNVGIGTNNPSYLVHAQNSTATGQSVMATSGNGQFIMAIGSQNSPGVAQEAFVGTLSNTRFKIKVNNVVKGSWTDGGLAIGTHSMASYLLHIKKPTSGDSTLMLETVSGGDPTIIFNSAAANRSGLIKYQDNGTNVGRIEYVHNGDRIDFQAGSATSATMSVKNGKVGIGTTAPDTNLHVYKASAGSITASSDAQLVVENSGVTAINLLSGPSSHGQILFGDSGDADDGQLGYDQTNREFYFKTAGNSTKRLLINSSGNVGIGTTTPTEPLTVSETSSGNLMQVASFVNPVGTANTGVRLWLSGTNTTTRGTFIDAVAESTANNHSLRFGTSANASAPVERMKITSSGYIHMAGASDVRLTLGSQGTAGNNDANWIRGNGNALSFNSAAGNYVWEVGGTTKMTLTSGGDLLVGTTTPFVGGVTISPLGVVQAERNNISGVFNRTSTDGEIIQFRKNGTSVGSIGTAGNQSYIHGAGTDVGLYWGSNNIYPYRSTGLNDNTINLGHASYRLHDAHFGGTVNVGENLVVTGNLTVNGTQTTLNTATLQVEDKNIVLNYGSGDTTSTADGAGITIQDAVNSSTDASFTWRASDDKFISSHPIRAFGGFELPDNTKLIAGDGSDLFIEHDGNNSVIRNTTGNLYIQNGTSGVILIQPVNNEASITAHANGAVELYHNGSKKFETTSTGVSITGKTTFSDDITVGHATTGTHSTSTSATTGTAIASFSKTSFRSAKYLVQVTNATDSTYHVTEILVIHDGTDTYMTEYGSMFTGTAAEATFTSDITGGGLVRLLATPASTDSMTFKVIRQNITV